MTQFPFPRSVYTLWSVDQSEEVYSARCRLEVMTADSVCKLMSARLISSSKLGSAASGEVGVVTTPTPESTLHHNHGIVYTCHRYTCHNKRLIYLVSTLCVLSS